MEAVRPKPRPKRKHPSRPKNANKQEHKLEDDDPSPLLPSDDLNAPPDVATPPLSRGSEGLDLAEDTDPREKDSPSAVLVVQKHTEPKSVVESELKLDPKSELPKLKPKSVLESEPDDTIVANSDAGTKIENQLGGGELNINDGNIGGSVENSTTSAPQKAPAPLSSGEDRASSVRVQSSVVASSAKVQSSLATSTDSDIHEDGQGVQVSLESKIQHVQSSNKTVAVDVMATPATLSVAQSGSSEVEVLDAPCVVQSDALVAERVPADATTTTMMSDPVAMETMIYPNLEPYVELEEVYEELIPYTEEDLSLLYPNPQLNSNRFFIDNFTGNVNYDQHVLYGLLMTYLKTKEALTNTLNQLKELKKQYEIHQKLVWQVETKEISSNAKCGDGTKISHSHTHKVASLYPEEAIHVNVTLKETRKLLEEELCIRCYSNQLAKVHVDHHLYLLMHSVPNLSEMNEDAPVTSWVPPCPPGVMDSYCAAIRDSVSVLFQFERRPRRDEEFSNDCRNWLKQLTSVLLRVSSFPDHQFILNHLLRCPEGVGQWGAGFLHVMSPLRTKEVLQMQFQQHRDGTGQDWGVGLGLHGDWGGPILDHFMTLLATLMLPIKEREKFLSFITSASGKPPKLPRQPSLPWTFIDEVDDDNNNNSAPSSPQAPYLDEADYIAFFNQFPFTDLFRHILQFQGEEAYTVQDVSSPQMLRLLAFGTCLTKLLGTAFTTLIQAKYKEFIKQVGLTIRYTIAFISDHWTSYRTYHLQRGVSMGTVEPGERGRYSLNRLQLEFDQLVIRAVGCLLIADKLGACQFLADLPFESVTLVTIWKIFWNMYCKQSSSSSGGGGDTSSSSSGGGGDTSTGARRMTVATETGRDAGQLREFFPTSVSDIQEAIKIGSHREQFVDRLMKTYTSQAVYLLTTLVNMARARSCDQDEEERVFINTVVLQIFECTQVIEYARETYSKTGIHLLDSIAIVHPFVISTLLLRVEVAIGAVGENCILLFKELPLHLWAPTSRDIDLVRSWLLDYQLVSSENILARNILGSLNWGSKTHVGSNELVLPWSLHCSTALVLIDAHCRHLPSLPGGRDYTPNSSSLVGKYATRFSTTQSQLDFAKWAWDMVLKLKLHPHQVVSHSMQMLSPQSSVTGGVAVGGAGGGGGGASTSGRSRSYSCASSTTISRPSWVHLDPHTDNLIVPDLATASEVEIAELRDAVKNEGVLACYVAMSLTDIGTDTDHFITSGLSMMTHLLNEGYYLPSLRVLANVTPHFFKHTKYLMQDTTFVQIVLSIANADAENATLTEKWLTGTVPVVARKLASMIQTQLNEAGGHMGSSESGDEVMGFWLDVLLGCPNWLKERNILTLLDTLCMAAFFKTSWTEKIQVALLEAYQSLTPVHPKKSLISSVYSSMASVVWQDGGTPSLFNAIPHEECPWLAYNALIAEQRFEEDGHIWKILLSRLKKDGRVTVETALKKSFSELKFPGSFPASHLCIYRWAEFCTTLSHTHPLYPLLWQNFFVLYLAKTSSDSSSPRKEGHGPRFFSSSQALSQRRGMKGALSECCKHLRVQIASMEEDKWEELMGGANLTDENKHTLRGYLPQSLKFYQTLRLWLEEPRLHTPALYLPSLPPQYDSERLAAIFQGNKSPWLEYVPSWLVKAELNSLVDEWMKLAAYQKPLRCEAHSPKRRTDTAGSRIQKRLEVSSSAVSPPPFQYCHAPFSPLPREVLMSREALIAAIHEDMTYILNQAKNFTSRIGTLTVLDEQYLSGLPELYTNEPRQFHVRVPCRSRFNRSHTCSQPATVVFRFNEMSVHGKWDGQLKNNRSDYDLTMTSLCSPVNFELIQKVMRTEHIVAELNSLAAGESQTVSTSDNVPLQNGVALFFKILSYIRVETRQFPPTNQFLISCMHILGQTFIQQDPLQSSIILQLLLTEHGKSDILAPLFHPNLSPQQFVDMYGLCSELATKEGPAVTFSVLTKFNVVTWLDAYTPSRAEVDQLIEYIGQALSSAGSKPQENYNVLLGVYRRHLVHMVEYNFPFHYNTVLEVIIKGTQAGNICVDVWSDLCQVISSPRQPDACNLGLQLLHQSIELLARTFQSLKVTHKTSLYSIVPTEYVTPIQLFVRKLCFGLVSKWAEDVAMETSRCSQAIKVCWKLTVDVFEPWICIHMERLQEVPTLNSDLILPCYEHECRFLRDMMDVFISCICFIDIKLQDPHDPGRVISLTWDYYCTHMSLPSTPNYTLGIYHASLEHIPWKEMHPDLVAMDSMLKLKLDDTIPPSCFIFLGAIFPLVEWQNVVESYCGSNFVGDPSVPLQFHIMFLQLLIMLISERQVMERDDTTLPQLVLKAQNFHWHLLDLKMYMDILNWQKNHCDPIAILHKGTPLSLSMRLLRAVAGFPSSTAPRQQLNKDTWEKRYSLLQVMVELVAQVSHRKDTDNHSYLECVTNLFQILVDVNVHEPTEQNSPQVISLVREVLNLLNVCSSGCGLLDKVMAIMKDMFDQLPNVHLISLSTITAACHTLASFNLMANIIECAIQSHFKTMTAPKPHPIELPPDPAHWYGWKSVMDSLVVPEDVVDSVINGGVEECSVLLLHGMMVRELPQCISIQQEHGIITRVLQWFTRMKKPRPSDEPKLLILWVKIMELVLRQITYGKNIPLLLPQITSFSSILMTFGGDKANEGFLGALGLGKRSIYSPKFRLIARSLGVFLQCQLPVDTSGQIQLRFTPNAPGHVKDGTKAVQPTPVYAVLTTKQSEQAFQNLESLLSNKQYSHLTDHVTQAVGFVTDPTNSILNCLKLLVSLSVILYPEHRYLDVMRITYFIS